MTNAAAWILTMYLVGWVVCASVTVWSNSRSKQFYTDDSALTDCLTMLFWPGVVPFFCAVAVINWAFNH